MKILITSDNHLGYKERDAVLSEDSYTTFDEILYTAKERRVDLVVLGGDLFHESKPSKDCLNRTIGLLKKYCIGETRSSLRSNGALNVQDENVNVSIPVVAIHGNHDDPTGVNMVSPIDILHSSGLVNYIGKSKQMDKVDVYPLLLEKEYKIALYGLGHIKDRRLYRIFTEGRITFHKPTDYKSWYNILLVHQNRIPREKEHLPTKLIDDFFDLVVYGHEHESLVVKDKFIILQPGSTVRTSLCEAESHDKYVYILHINDSPSLEHVKLKSIRPFLMESVRLGEENIEERIKKTIEDMIERIKNNRIANEGRINRTLIDVGERTFECGSSGQVHVPEVLGKEYCSKGELLPLIRLRIDTDRNVVINRHKISVQFKSDVANPNDMLVLSRRKTKDDRVKFRSKSDKIEISQILKDILRNVEFGALTGTKFSEGLRAFVFKGEKNAFVEMVRNNVREIVDKIDHLSILGVDVDKVIKNTVCEDFFEDKYKENETERFVLPLTHEEIGKRIKKEEEESIDVSFSFSKYL